MARNTAPLEVEVHHSIEKAVGNLCARQDPAGWWKGELRTNVTMDAEDLLLRRFLGILRRDELDAAARWIRSQQRADGTWATFPGGPGDLSTTVEAYTALRLAGDAPAAEHMRHARAFVLDNGGIAATRVFTRIWLALFGEWSWDDLPAMPPELVLLPSWVPLNVYDWACWARQTVVPITVVATLRPCRPLPFSLAELHTGARTRRGRSLTERAFGAADRLLKSYGALPVHPGRAHALRRAGEWIVARQEADGGWGGIQPPWVYSILALHLLGYPDDHPVMTSALAGLDGFLVHDESPDGPLRRLEACQSPVWDTCLTVTALRDAGLPPDAPELVRAADWMLAEEIRCRGDWSVRRPRLQPGGWAFEFANDCYPDVDDTAEVVLALHRLDPDARSSAAIDRGVDWVVGMRSQARESVRLAKPMTWVRSRARSQYGGWGAFDADNTRRLVERLPFCDFGAVIDPPSADVTAHVVEMLAARGRADTPACRDGVRWLLDAQEPDGSWFGRWGCNHVYGVGAVVPALVAAGMHPEHDAITRAVSWLEEHQNADGGWGEDMRSYRDPAWRGRGASTPSQTAWALLALLCADATAPSVERGVRWLLEHQRADGGWDEDVHTGTGFPGDFYITYEMYRDVFPLTALGRYRTACADGGRWCAP